MGKYIDLFTDFGFKKIFGEESNKDLLMDFLNQLITDRGKIIELTFLKNEHLGSNQEDRKAIFDLYCESEKGEKFIVELQKVKQKFFKDRSVFYATFPIQEQAETGDWNFKLNPVYTVAIMDFSFDDTRPDQFIHDVWLMEKATNTIFYDKLRFIYLEMPKFKKTEQDLKTHFDKWLYLLKNLPSLQDVPSVLQEKTFRKLFNLAEIASYSKEERVAYQESLKYKRDLKNSLDTYKEEGREEGRKEGRVIGIQEKTIQVAKKAIKKGLDNAMIQELTDLSIEEIEKIRREM